MPYNFNQIPEVATVEELRSWLIEEFKTISQSLNEATELELRASKHAPIRPREGMIVHADGTSWNPGSGAGTYRYQSGAWVKITAPGDLSDFARKSVGEDINAVWRFNGGVGGTEGGEIHFTKPPSGTTLTDDIVQDIQADTVRFFEGGGASRGFIVNIAGCAGGAGTDLRALFDSSNKGLVPASGGGTSNFLRADGSFQTPPVGSGGLTLITSAAAPAAATWTITGLGGYKVLWVSLRNIQQASGTSRQLQLELSGNAGSSFGGIKLPTGGGAFATGVNTVMNFLITRADQANNQMTFIFSFVTNTGSQIDTGSVGPINAFRLSWSGAATNFTGGDVDVYGWK